jgi:invasion protein IalB
MLEKCPMRIVAVVAALTFAVGANAQIRQAAEQGEATKKPPELGAPPAVAPDRTTETFGDWSIVCAAPGGAGERACEVNTSIVLRGQTAPFARVAIVRPAKDKPVQLIALVPVNVATASPVKVGSDAAKGELTLPLRSCVPQGCVARAEATRDQLQALGKTQGQLTLVDASGKSASVQFSLRGLDQALEAYFKQQEK